MHLRLPARIACMRAPQVHASDSLRLLKPSCTYSATESHFPGTSKGL